MLVGLCASFFAQAQVQSITFSAYFPTTGGLRWIYYCSDSTGKQALTQDTITDSSGITFASDDRVCALSKTTTVNVGVTKYSLSKETSYNNGQPSSTTFFPPVDFLPVVGAIGDSYASSGSLVYTDQLGTFSGTYTNTFTLEALARIFHEAPPSLLLGEAQAV